MGSFKDKVMLQLGVLLCMTYCREQGSWAAMQASMPCCKWQGAADQRLGPSRPSWLSGTGCPCIVAFEHLTAVVHCGPSSPYSGIGSSSGKGGCRKLLCFTAAVFHRSKTFMRASFAITRAPVPESAKVAN